MKKLLSTVAAAAILSGSAFAATSTNHVAVAPNGLGDALIFQEYFASTGWTTHLKVVNTDVNRAVVARVAVYESRDSQEVRDFYIYLSPGDVWTADLRATDTGVPEIISMDDSTYRGPDNITGAPTFASTSPTGGEENAVITSLTSIAGTTPTAGYVNVVAVAAKLGSKLVSGWQPGQPIDKRVIYSDFHNIANIGTTADLWTYPRIDTLTGTEIVRDTNANRAMSLPTVALKNLLAANVAPANGTSVLVDQSDAVRNQQLTGSFRPTAAIAGLTDFSRSVGNGGLAPTGVSNSLAELDAVLSRGSSVIPYEQNNDGTGVAPSVVWINFPTENLLESTAEYQNVVTAGTQPVDITYNVTTDIRNEGELNVRGVFSPVAPSPINTEVSSLSVPDLVNSAVSVVPSLTITDFRAGWLILDLQPNVTSYNLGVVAATTNTLTGTTKGVTSTNLNSSGNTIAVASNGGTAVPALVSVMSASAAGDQTRLNWMNAPYYETTVTDSAANTYSKYEISQ